MGSSVTGDHSIDLVVRSDRLQENCLDALVLDELKDDPQVITGAARKRANQLAFEFVSPQMRIESILGQGR